MPSEDARRYELAVYVEPEHVEAFEELMKTADDRMSIPLALEKIIGEYLSCHERGVKSALLNRGIFAEADYGVGVAEVYPEGAN